MTSMALCMQYYMEFWWECQVWCAIYRSGGGARYGVLYIDLVGVPGMACYI